MKLVIQRVNKASVSVGGDVVGKINYGYLVMLGVGEGDTKEDAGKLVKKLINLRVMGDSDGKINLSIKDVGGEVLLISQFTLYADTNKGNRPSFVKAAEPDVAERLYEYFITKLKEQGIRVESGKFGEYMKIDANLDGPVTIELVSSKL